MTEGGDKRIILLSKERGRLRSGRIRLEDMGFRQHLERKFVKGIQGDYYNVMGLPASRVYHELKKLGVLELGAKEVEKR